MKLVGFLLAAVLLVGGVVLAGAGMGWFGGGTSTAGAVVGALLAGFGIALGVSIVQHARQRAQLSELERSRYGGRR